MSRYIPCFLFLFMGSCQPQLIDDPIPLAAFSEISVNINLPEYQAIRNDGGYVEINDKGVRGIIVYRLNSITFRAYERNCSYHPNGACATVNVHTSRLFLEDPCCGSTFSFDEGTPTGGPAWRPLRQYRTNYSGTTLTLTDEVI